MFVYLFVIFLILYFRYNLSISYDEKKERGYCYLIYTILILLAGVRYVLPGTDMSGYMDYYNSMSSIKWDEIPEQWNGDYVVYFYMCKAFSYTHLSYHYWFIFIELLYLTGFSRLINRFSTDKLFDIFLFFTIGLYSFSFYGLKQVVAMAFVWHSFALFHDKKYLFAVLFAIFAFFTHKTSAFFLLSYVLIIIKNIRLLFVIIVSLATVIITAPTLVFSFLVDSVNSERYIMYLSESAESSYTLFFVYLLLFIIAIRENRIMNTVNDANDYMIMGLAMITVVVQLFTRLSGTAFRLALYYCPFLIIMIGNNVKNKNVGLVIVFLLTVFMLYSGRNYPYRFFWQ